MKKPIKYRRFCELLKDNQEVLAIAANRKMICNYVKETFGVYPKSNVFTINNTRYHIMYERVSWEDDGVIIIS